MPVLTKTELTQQRAVRSAILSAAKGASRTGAANEITKFTYTGPSDDFMNKYNGVKDDQKVFDVRLKYDPQGKDSETDFLVYVYGQDANGTMHESERAIAAVTVKNVRD
jgi:hypothetical protein